MGVEHSNLLKKTMIAVSKAEIAICFRIETGVARSMDGKRIVRYGLNGMSDIIAISKLGYFVCFEIKIGKDILSEVQENFKNMILKNNGYYFIIRNENDIAQAISNISNRVAKE